MTRIVPRTPFSSEIPAYRLPVFLATKPGVAVLGLRTRSVARDAHSVVASLPTGRIQISGSQYIPTTGPLLVICNHYCRPGLGVWWTALAITSAVSEMRSPGVEHDLHWAMTSAWRFEGAHLHQRIVASITRWAFARVARVYGFVTMPPMPPDPDETTNRAASILRAVRLARHEVPPGGILALAPEGQKTDGEVGYFPTGAGTFISLLIETGLAVLPVGVTERRDTMHICFGPTFSPTIPEDRSIRDKSVSRQVRSRITALLPVPTRLRNLETRR
jgi:1-acyl-sn-glycerol-3-phosphate acyltransferase